MSEITTWYPITSLTEPTGRTDGLTPERHRRMVAALAALEAHRRRSFAALRRSA